MMIVRAFISLVGLGFAWSAAATPLTLSEAQSLAVTAQPRLEGQTAEVEGQRQSAIAAAQLPDPQLKLGISNVPTDTFSLDGDPMTQRTIGLMQEFPGGAKRRYRGEVASARARQSAAQLQADVRAVKREAGLAWLDVFYAQQAQQMLKAEDDAMTREVDASRIAYRTGRVSQDEALSVQNRLYALRDRELQTAGELQRARTRLARWIGNAPGREVADALTGLSPPPPLETLQTHLATHPAIATVDQRIAAARAQASLARESRKPDWNAEIDYSKRGSAFGDMVSAQIGIALPIFPGKRQDRDIAASLAFMDQARDERKDRLRALEADLVRDYADWDTASHREALLSSDTLPNARLRVQAALIAYRTGKADLARVFQARIAALDTELKLLAQHVAKARAEVRLAYYEGDQ